MLSFIDLVSSSVMASALMTSSKRSKNNCSYIPLKLSVNEIFGFAVTGTFGGLNLCGIVLYFFIIILVVVYCTLKFLLSLLTFSKLFHLILKK